MGPSLGREAPAPNSPGASSAVRLAAGPPPDHGRRELSTGFNAVCPPDAQKTQENRPKSRRGRVGR